MEYQELVTTVAEQTQYTPREVRRLVRVLTDVIGDALANGLDVQVEGLGKLNNVYAAPKSGRNPLTGERMPIPASRRIKFEPTKHLRERVKASAPLFNRESLEDRYGLPKENNNGKIRSTDRSRQGSKRKESRRRG